MSRSPFDPIIGKEIRAFSKVVKEIQAPTRALEKTMRKLNDLSRASADLPKFPDLGFSKLRRELEKVGLADLRAQAKHTQIAIAERFEVTQGAISQLEKRNDMLISSLSAFVESLGGRLELTAHFDDRPSKRITQFDREEGAQVSAELKGRQGVRARMERGIVGLECNWYSQADAWLLVGTLSGEPVVRELFGRPELDDRGPGNEPVGYKAFARVDSMLTGKYKDLAQSESV